MGDSFVSQREFDRYREAETERHAQLRRDLEALEERYDNGLKAAVEKQTTSRAARIGAVGAGAGVVAAWVAVIELWHSLGR